MERIHLDHAEVKWDPNGWHRELHLYAASPWKSPETSDFHWHRSDNIFWGATPEGWCRGFVHDPNNPNGYGGWEFTIDVCKEGEFTFHGPWSGRPAVYLDAGFPAYDEVIVHQPNMRSGIIVGLIQGGIDFTLDNLDLGYKTRIAEVGETFVNGRGAVDRVSERRLVIVPIEEGN